MNKKIYKLKLHQYVKDSKLKNGSKKLEQYIKEVEMIDGLNSWDLFDRFATENSVVECIIKDFLQYYYEKAWW